MKHKTKSLLEEINSITPVRDKKQILRSRGENAIAGMINLLEYIEKQWGEDEAERIVSRVMLSVKKRDPQKFYNTLSSLLSPVIITLFDGSLLFFVSSSKTNFLSSNSIL